MNALTTDHADNWCIFARRLRWRENLPSFLPQVGNCDNAAIFYVVVLLVFFLEALSGVIERYFGPITLSWAIKHLFLLSFSGWRYRRYRRYRYFRAGAAIALY